MSHTSSWNDASVYYALYKRCVLRHDSSRNEVLKLKSENDFSVERHLCRHLHK
jgi:hypothetical protein